MTRSDWKPDLYVVARYLETLYESERSFTRRQLQMAVRLNHDLHAKYLTFLMERDLVTFAKDDRDEDTARITPRGRDAFHRFVGWVRDLLGSDEPQ